MKKTALILFGATGDLSREKIFPALFELSKKADSEEVFTIMAIGRREYSQADFREHIERGKGVYENAENFWSTIQYLRMDFLAQDGYADLSTVLEEYDQRIFYLAVPPDGYTTILKNIAHSKIYSHEKGWSRVVIEKPFGINQETARELNELVCSLFHEESTYRIDHYLGKETVENLLAFRFANPLFAPAWSGKYIDHIQITSAEKIGLQNRIAYYAQVGATRDLIQNHLLQLITLLTMDRPAELSFDGLADAKISILKGLKAHPEQSVFGQYDSPEVAEHMGNTETYAMTTFSIDTEEWRGVPIYVRTGKCLPEKVIEVSVYFKEVANRLFEPKEGVTANVFTFRIQPNEGIFVRFAVKSPGERQSVSSAQMIFCYESLTRTGLVDAYENLISSVKKGEHLIALRGDTIEESWRVIDELLSERDRIPLVTYPIGSWGPAEASAVLQEDGREWKVEDQDVCNGIVIS